MKNGIIKFISLDLILILYLSLVIFTLKCFYHLN